jgi:hypothetical protein
MDQHVTITWTQLEAGDAGEVLEGGAIDELVGLQGYEVSERSFYGDIELSVGGVGFRFPERPVFDFILDWRYALDRLALEGTATVRLTEQGEPLVVTLSGHDVTMSVDATGVSATSPFLELLGAVLRFGQKVLEDLTRECPDLLAHDLVDRLYRELGVILFSREHFLRHSAAMAKRYHRDS